MKVVILVLFLALQGEAPTVTEIRGFSSVKSCAIAAQDWLRDKVAMRNVYVASAHCEERLK